MPKVTIQLPDNIYKFIADRFGDDAMSDFSTTAIEEIVSWLSADQRPTSITELETNRIYLIYSRIRKDQIPTAEDIGQLFNLPLGRARYILQNINYRHPEFMKLRRIKAIIAALDKGDISEDGLPVAVVPKECEAYVYNIATEMALAHRISTTPIRKKLLEGTRIELGAKDREPLLRRLREELGKLPE